MDSSSEQKIDSQHAELMVRIQVVEDLAKRAVDILTGTAGETGLRERVARLEANWRWKPVATFLAGLVVGGAVFLMRDVPTREQVRHMIQVESPYEKDKKVISSDLETLKQQHLYMMGQLHELNKIAVRQCVAIGIPAKECNP